MTTIKENLPGKLKASNTKALLLSVKNRALVFSHGEGRD